MNIKELNPWIGIKNQWCQLKHIIIGQHEDKPHRVFVNGVKVGVLPKGMYAHIIRQTIRDPIIYFEQLLNFVNVALVSISEILKFIPILVFWFCLYEYVFNQTEFLDYYHHALTNGIDVHSLRQVLPMAFQFFIAVYLLASAITYKKLLGFENKFVSKVHTIVRHHFNVPAVGKIDVLDENQLAEYERQLANSK